MEEMSREKIVSVLGEIAAYFRSTLDAMDGGTLACEVFRRYAEAAENALALLKEYAEMEKTYSQVLMETTGNLLSKTNYTLAAIMDRIREHYCDGCDVREELDTLLKAQEPRVMTLAEALAADYVYLEIRLHARLPCDCCILAVDPDGGILPLKKGFAGYLDGEEYGETWRCWTSRPTDEQREAVKWE